jgi:hypothetical protein
LRPSRRTIGSALTSSPRSAQADSISAQVGHVERHALAAVGDVSSGSASLALRTAVLAALLRALLAIQHVGARDLCWPPRIRPSSTWSWMSSIWKVPPAGRERSSARTTLRSGVDQFAHAGRGRALRAVTARKAFITATAIFDGSNDHLVPRRCGAEVLAGGVAITG